MFDLLIVPLHASKTMDSDDEMMLFFMQKEKNASTDQEEYLAIIAALLQMQADDLRSVACTRGGSKFGRRKSKDRHRMGVSCHATCQFF
jgi:hypothetical protein